MVFPPCSLRSAFFLLSFRPLLVVDFSSPCPSVLCRLNPFRNPFENGLSRSASPFQGCCPEDAASDPVKRSPDFFPAGQHLGFMAREILPLELRWSHLLVQRGVRPGPPVHVRRNIRLESLRFVLERLRPWSSFFSDVSSSWLRFYRSSRETVGSLIFSISKTWPRLSLNAPRSSVYAWTDAPGLWPGANPCHPDQGRAESRHVRLPGPPASPDRRRPRDAARAVSVAPRIIDS